MARPVVGSAESFHVDGRARSAYARSKRTLTDLNAGASVVGVSELAIQMSLID